MIAVRLSHPQNVGELSKGVVKYDLIIYTHNIHTQFLSSVHKKQISQRYEWWRYIIQFFCFSGLHSYILIVDNLGPGSRLWRPISAEPKLPHFLRVSWWTGVDEGENFLQVVVSSYFEPSYWFVLVVLYMCNCVFFLVVYLPTQKDIS